ncbi:ABC transporter permease [Fusobacterium sp.]|uniref:ABC transporter permease n=1 Tax=Fusobacterium sp. TaxID=68766 RepID=UPI00396CA31E
MKRYLQTLIKIVSFILFIFAWNYIAFVVDNKFLFPSVWDILKALNDIFREDIFFPVVLRTLKKLVMAIFFSGILAIAVGVISYRNRLIQTLLLPYISFIKSVPTVALIILVLIWAKAEVVPVIVATMILFPILYDSILSGIESIDRDIIRMSQVFKVKKTRVLREVYIPGVYFHIAGGIHSLIGLGFKVIIAGEVLSQENLTIGGEILLNKTYLESSKIFAWVIVVILINFFIEQGILMFNRKINSWR